MLYTCEQVLGGRQEDAAEFFELGRSLDSELRPLEEACSWPELERPDDRADCPS